jgi:hypothetical protein
MSILRLTLANWSEAHPLSILRIISSAHDLGSAEDTPEESPYIILSVFGASFAIGSMVSAKFLVSVVC